MKKQLLIIALIVIPNLLVISQENGYSGGFQFKPMLGSGLFSNKLEGEKQDSLNFQIQQKFGYVFGMTIRKEFTKTLAIESGLRFTQRNYTATIDSNFNAYSNDLDYRLIAYEVPLKAIIRLRSSRKSYFNVALGGQLDLYPSDIFANNFEWQVEVLRKSWIQGSFLANLGWEIHPDKKGTFYAGLSYNQPFVSPFSATIGQRNSNRGLSKIFQTGTYFSLDFRYYFQDKKTK